MYGNEIRLFFRRKMTSPRLTFIIPQNPFVPIFLNFPPNDSLLTSKKKKRIFKKISLILTHLLTLSILSFKIIIFLLPTKFSLLPSLPSCFSPSLIHSIHTRSLLFFFFFFYFSLIPLPQDIDYTIQPLSIDKKNALLPGGEIEN
jgi:hypothetical protein